MSGSFWLVTPTALDFPRRRQQDSDLFALPLRLLGGNRGYRDVRVVDAPHAVVTDRSFLFEDAERKVWLIERQEKPAEASRPEQWLIACDDDGWRACLVPGLYLANYFIKHCSLDHGTLAVDHFCNRLVSYCGTKVFNVEGGRTYHEDGKGGLGPIRGFGPLGKGFEQSLSAKEYFGWPE